MIFRKIKKKNGASIVLAMVVFLIVSMISLVVVQAAMTNAARVRTRKQNQQGYLNVKSAVDLLEKEILIENLADGSTSAKYILVTWEETGEGESQTITYNNPSCGTGFTKGSSDTLFGTILLEMVKAWKDSTQDTISPHENITITPSSSTATNLGTVDVSIAAVADEDDFDLFCVVRDKESGYAMRILFDGTYEIHEENNRALLYFTTAEVTQ